MKLNLIYVLTAASLLPLSPFWLRADTTTSGAEAAQMELVKRQQLVFSANQALTDGQRFLDSAHYDEAADRFQYAVDALTNGGVSARAYNQATVGLAAAKAGQAQQLAKESKYAQAAQRLQEAINLQPKNPAYPRALENLKKEQLAYEAQTRDPESTIGNPAVTEEFKDRVAAVQKLLFQGDDYFRTGQYDKAEDTYSKILILDPYNKAARNKMAHIESYKTRAAGFRHAEYEQEAMTRVNEQWSEAISPDLVVAEKQGADHGDISNRAKITRKLQSIIIDKVNFDKLDIATVIQFLTQKSKELDPDKQGINFVLRLTADAAVAPAGAAVPDAGAPPALAAPGDATAPATPPPPQIHREVSITLENVPLVNILEYIIQQTNLQYSVEDYAVYLRPSVDEGETLTVRTFLAPPTLFKGSSLKITTAAAGSASATNIENVTSNVQKELANQGIRFPAGATATFLPGSSKLVVRNTPEQLDLIANLIEQLSKEQPQVEIEAKIAEFTQDAIKGLTFNYFLGIPPLTTTASAGVQTQTSLRDTTYTTSGSATAGLNPNSIDNLIQANVANNSGLPPPAYPITGAAVGPNIPSTLTIGAILDGQGFAAVMSAINNLKGVSLLSAPSVTTQSGLKASISIVREFPYPTSFEKPQLSSSAISYSSGIGRGQPLNLAVPPTPREFVTQDIGVSLEVKPTTYPDQRIDLDITKAEVVDFDGFIDYGAAIVERLTQEQPVPNILTPGTINQPVFNVRRIVTRLQVLDGQTAVLGGLIREDTQEVNDKIPVLGDLPLVGRLFQSKVSERTKKSLLLFVTARLIRSNGKLQYIKTLNAESEEKLPAPEPIGPGINLPPLPEGEPNS
jgi:general secretion pathway protein D